MGLLNKLKNVLNWRKKARCNKTRQAASTNAYHHHYQITIPNKETQGHEAVDVSAVSGIPKSLTTHESKSSLKRTVQIFFHPNQPCNLASIMLATLNSHLIAIKPKWENPLMGWTSSRDTMQALKIKFGTVEEARRFAERQGWDVEIVGDKETVEMEKKKKGSNQDPNRMLTTLNTVRES